VNDQVQKSLGKPLTGCPFVAPRMVNGSWLMVSIRTNVLQPSPITHQPFFRGGSPSVHTQRQPSMAIPPFAQVSQSRLPLITRRDAGLDLRHCSVPSEAFPDRLAGYRGIPWNGTRLSAPSQHNSFLCITTESRAVAKAAMARRRQRHREKISHG